MNLVQNYSDQFGNSQRSLLSPTGGVKNIPPTTENWLRKLYTYSKKNYKSTEDKHETNHVNNKYNDTNTDTRKLHNQRASTKSAKSSSSHLDDVSHAPHGSKFS